MRSIVCGADLVPGAQCIAGVLGNDYVLGGTRTVTPHVGYVHLSGGVPRVLYGQVGIEAGAAGSFREVEGGGGGTTGIAPG